MKGRIVAELVGFVLFLCFGVWSRQHPAFQSDKWLWDAVFVAFILTFLIELCFVAPFQHAQKLMKERDETFAGLNREITRLNKRPKARAGD